MRQSEELKKIINLLKKTTKYLDRIIEYRDDVHNTRSEAWRDSEKGQDYEGKTWILCDVKEMVEEAVNIIEDDL